MTKARPSAGSMVDETLLDRSSLDERAMPGTIDQSSTQQIHTRAAIQMLYGMEIKTRQGKVNNSPGLFAFAHGTNMLINYSHQQDPYADRQLLRVERHLESVSLTVPPVEDWLLELLSDQNNSVVAIDVHGSRSPVSKVFRFANPYSWRALDYVVRLDRIMQYALCALRVGRLARPERDAKVYSCMNILRRLFMAGSGYEYSGVTREDILNSTDLATKVILSRGDLDADILNGETIPQLRPPYTIRFSG